MASVVLLACASRTNATQIDLAGPVGSGRFGSTVTLLPNGNLVITDPTRADGSAVYLYSAEGALISTLTAQNAGSLLGSGGVVVLSNGNYVIVSPFWDNGTSTDLGAVTWGNANSGVAGVISATNSLIGTQPRDQVGYPGVTALTNGNYVVASATWDNGTVIDVGALTWGNGSVGTSGAVTTSNSIVGTTANDQIGLNRADALRNGHYVVRCPMWDNGAVVDAGAVVWANGNFASSGAISVANALVGAQTDDAVGLGAFQALSNGNYVVGSIFWDHETTSDVGAITWGSGSGGTAGIVSAQNSLIGGSALDRITANGGVVELSNGNVVAVSPDWDSTSATNVGAVTWLSGSRATGGVVSASNSIVGSTAFDAIGSQAVTALRNGNYVINSPMWNNGAIVDAGAATWVNGEASVSGIVSASNSLVGTQAFDHVAGYGSVLLTNGNYVVISQDWSNAATSLIAVGAVTWGDGATGIVGPVSASNSLIGTTDEDRVGGGFVRPLRNGNYLVCTPDWDSGAIMDVGAATWGNGGVGTLGVVSTTNSLTGTQTHDRICSDAIQLRNGNYAVNSPDWDNGAVINAGALTWGNGSTATSGAVSALNSLVGTQFGDRVGDQSTALADGNYVATTEFFENGAIQSAGAVTLANGASGLIGTIDASNSVLGTASNGGATMVFAYDAVRARLAVGRPLSSLVSLFDDRVFRNGFE